MARPHEDDEVSPQFEKTTIKLTPSHRWKAAPGYDVLVIDRGAVRFEVPHGWVVLPTRDGLAIHDRRPPADECRIQITVFRLPPLTDGRSWNDLPLDGLLHGARMAGNTGEGDDDDDNSEELVEPTIVHRPDLSYAWAASSAPDRENGRPIITRQMVARARGVQPLITFHSYANREAHFMPVWNHLIETLRLANPVNLLGDPMN